MLRRFTAVPTAAPCSHAAAAASFCGGVSFFGSLRCFTSLPDLKKDPEAALPKLDFDWAKGVPPVLSPRQVELHYTKHHKAYVDKLNAIAKDVKGRTIEDIADEAFVKQTEKGDAAAKVVYNQAAQHFNHSFYWKCLAPNGKPMPSALADELAASFGSVDAFKKAFAESCVNNFGSGWTWLVYNPKAASDGAAAKPLSIWNSSNAVMPQSHGLRPVFTIDVWEHAYYKDFENRRADYVNELWAIVNWEFVAQQLAAVKKS